MDCGLEWSNINLCRILHQQFAIVVASHCMMCVRIGEPGGRNRKKEIRVALTLDRQTKDGNFLR